MQNCELNELTKDFIVVSRKITEQEDIVVDVCANVVEYVHGLRLQQDGLKV